ncbi:MAG: hypothetical protein KDC05_11395 [Bacteroidales bacterium]|nr:hypothetical protein [Bacteroidales bacterium]
MKKITVLLLVFILAGSVLMAQRIYFCDNYTQNGEPIGPNTRVSCPAEGGYIYILYQNGGINLSSGDYLVSVDKLSGNSYVPFDVVSIKGDLSKNWFVYDYKFMTAGDYRITVKNPLMKEMVTDYLKLVSEETKSTSSGSSYNYDDPSSTFYYTYSKVEASTSINSSTGEIPAAYTSFTIDATLGGRITFKVTNNGKSLGTDKLIVYVDKKDESGKFNAFDTKYFDVTNKNATWATFYVDYYSKGEYNITVYSASMVFINSVTITLNYKN